MDSEIVHFVGHSNGTYILAQALQKYATMKVDRVAFIGSVVASDFPWDDFFRDGRVNKFRNDRSESDWVVGIFAGFFQLLGKIVPASFLTDIGNGGLRGFENSAGPNHRENCYFEGSHGAPTQGENLKTLATYVATGEDRSRDGLRQNPKPFTDVASKLNWLVLGIGLLIFTFVVPFEILTLPCMQSFYQNLGWHQGYVQIGYFLVLLGIISTI